MSTPRPQPGNDSAGNSALADAVQKNMQATDEVQKAADDLAVAHAVLDTKVAHGAVDEEARRAVAETAQVEKRLTRSAEKLEQVNETLQRELSKPT